MFFSAKDLPLFFVFAGGGDGLCLIICSFLKMLTSGASSSRKVLIVLIDFLSRSVEAKRQFMAAQLDWEIYEINSEQCGHSMENIRVAVGLLLSFWLIVLISRKVICWKTSDGGGTCIIDVALKCSNPGTYCNKKDNRQAMINAKNECNYKEKSGNSETEDAVFFDCKHLIPYKGPVKTQCRDE